MEAVPHGRRSIEPSLYLIWAARLVALKNLISARQPARQKSMSDRPWPQEWLPFSKLLVRHPNYPSSVPANQRSHGLQNRILGCGEVVNQLRNLTRCPEKYDPNTARILAPGVMDSAAIDLTSGPPSVWACFCPQGVGEVCQRAFWSIPVTFAWLGFFTLGRVRCTVLVCCIEGNQH